MKKEDELKERLEKAKKKYGENISIFIAFIICEIITLASLFAIPVNFVIEGEISLPFFLGTLGVCIATCAIFDLPLYFKSSDAKKEYF